MREGGGRLAGMLGLCARAGRLITGEKAVVQAVRAKSALVALLDSDAAPNAVKAVGQACQSHGVPLIRTQPFALGEAIGKPGRMAAVITDPRMAARAIELSAVE